jgi:hypothetical protein
MKKCLIAGPVIALLAATNIANAQPSLTKWVALSNDGYVLKPDETSNAYLLAVFDSNARQVTVSVMKPNNCLNGASGDLGSAGTYKIDSTFVKFHGYCVNGSEFDEPSSADGKLFFSKSVEQNSSLVIDTGNGTPLHYQTAGYSDVKTKLIATFNAL